MIRQILALSVWLILLTLVFVPLEAMAGLHPRRIWRKTVGADLFFYFFNSILPAAVLSAPLAVLAVAVHRVTPWTYSHAIESLPLIAQLALGLVISEVGSYWGHRWSHEWPFLWRFHAVHHSAEHLDYLVNTRAHPIDLVFVRLCGLVPLYVLGFGQPAVGGSLIPLYVTVIGTAWTFFIHANVRWRFGPLEWLLSTPPFHHWHHTNCEMRDHNYAALLPWIDRVFGTHHLPKHFPTVYGVDEPVEASIVGQMLLRPAAGSAQRVPAKRVPAQSVPAKSVPAELQATKAA